MPKISGPFVAGGYRTCIHLSAVWDDRVSGRRISFDAALCRIFEVAVITCIFLLIVVLLYYGFQPGDSILLLATPILFFLKCRLPFRFWWAWRAAWFR